MGKPEKYTQFSPKKLHEIAAIEEHLREEKARNAKRVPYIFTLRRDYPGKVLLSYLPSSSVNHEYISIGVAGLRFRQRHFDSLARLVPWFKANFSNAKTIAAPTASPSANSLFSLPSGVTPNAPESHEAQSGHLSVPSNTPIVVGSLAILCRPGLLF